MPRRAAIPRVVVIGSFIRLTGLVGLTGQCRRSDIIVRTPEVSTAAAKNWQSADVELLGVVAERAEAHSEHFGGPGLHAAGAFERQAM